MSKEAPNKPSVGLHESLKDLLRRVWRSFWRSPSVATPLGQSQIVMDNLWLHLHPVKTRRHVLRFGFTLGLGWIAFVLFGVLTVTGMLLMFYYLPATEHAYASVKDLHFATTFGRITRNLHRWAAHGMVLVVFLHLCRVFYTASYKSPREFNWVIGVGLLLLTLGLSFTGYLLPWDQLAYWAVTVGASIVSHVPVWGETLRFALLGGNLVGQATLLRFYVLHVAVLPGIMALLIAAHLWRIRKDGDLSAPEEDGREGKRTEGERRGEREPRGHPDTQTPTSNPAEREPGTIFPRSPSKTYGLMALARGDTPAVDKESEETVFSWPHLIFRELLLTLGVLVILMALALIFDAPLEELANPSKTPNPAKAPWFSLGLQELVHYSAFLGGVLTPTMVVLGLILLPYLDRNPAGVGVWFHPQRRREILVFTIFVTAVVTLTLIGAYFRGPGWSWVWPWQGGTE